MKIIIGLVGQIAAGKGTVAEYLEKNYESTTYRFSTILRDVLKRLYSDINRTNLQSISTALRQALGEDLLAKVIARDVENDNNKIIVVDGVRRLADIKYLKENPNFYLIKITAEPKIRYERLIKRNENSDDMKKTYNEFLADQQKESDAEIPVVMEQANFDLNNNGDLDMLYNQINQLINKIKQQ